MPATAVKERPIIFSGESVRAILEGRKTQTRRVIKGIPSDADEAFLWSPPAECDLPVADAGLYARKHDTSEDSTDGWLRFLGGCPYGIPGDRLYVKETWQQTTHEISDEPGIVYRATDPDWQTMDGWSWKSPLFMPRWASRITLEVIGLRVERLQEIIEEDAVAEGFQEREWREGPPDTSSGDNLNHLTAKGCFRETWQKLNAKRGFPWESNPWVWCVTFRRVED